MARRRAPQKPPVSGIATPLDDSVLYESAPVCLCVLDANLRYVRVNQRFVDVTGNPASHYLGRTVDELSPDIAAGTRKLFRQIARTRRPIRDIQYTGDTNTTPGRERSWTAHWSPIQDARGRVVAVNIAFDESSERLEVEAERSWMISELDRERRHLTAILEQLPAGVILAEAPGGRILFGNKACARIFRHPFLQADAVPDYSKWKVLRLDGSVLPVEEYPLARAAVRGEVISCEELMIERGDGTRGFISVNAAPIFDGRRRRIAAVATFFDVTGQRITLDALRESEARFRRIAENSPFGLGAYDTEGRIIFINPRLIEIVGYRPGEVRRLEDWFRKVYPDPDYRREVEEGWALDVERVRRGELRHSPVREYRMRCRDGSTKDVEITFALGDDFTYAIFNDITERKAAESEARRLTQQLEQLVVERTQALARVNTELRQEITERLKLQCDLIAVAEREQRRLGEGLHDELGQQLAGVGLMAAVLERELRAERHPKAAKLAQFGELLRRAVSSTRDMAKGFYPVVLEQGGLLIALKDLAATTQSISGVQVRVRHDPAFHFADSAAIHLYRIAQEALNNALRHAAPKLVTIEMTAPRGVSRLRITNDGRAYNAPSASTGLGLQFIRHRAELIGGSVKIARGLRGGCELTCTLPAL